MSRLLRIVTIIAALLVILAPAAVALADPPQDAGAGASPPAAGPAPGATDEKKDGENAEKDGVYAESLAALTKLFVLAVLLESALSVIFNWRAFLTYFSLSGVKTIIMIAVSYFFVARFNIDIVADLMHAYQPKGGPVHGWPTELITALILAGGSAGVYNIMRGLGYRSGSREEEVNPRPPKDKAWIAVWAKRKNAVGEIFVTVREVKPAAGKAPAPIAGVIGARRPNLWELLWRNWNRFPQNGGYTLMPNVTYEITVEAKDSAGNRITRLGDPYVLAAGAIVDFDVTI